jgi:hypothetical protein
MLTFDILKGKSSLINSLLSWPGIASTVSLTIPVVHAELITEQK